MLRLAMNEMTTYRWSFDEDVQNYSEVGIEGIGIWREKLADYGEQNGIELLWNRDLRVSSLSWAGGFTGSDGRSHSESIEDGLDAVQLAAALQADCLVVYTGGRGGHTRTHARRLTFKALVELASAAEHFRVNLAIEPVHSGCGREWTFLSSVEPTLALIDEVASDRVKFVFDTYHLGQSASVLDRLPEWLPAIGLVQLGDAKRSPAGEQDRCPLGEGAILLDGIIQCLDESGYQGFCEVELIGQGIEDYDYWTRLWNSTAFVRESVAAQR